MKFSAAAVPAAAVGASAHYGSNATVVTEVVTAYTTYCPGPTHITHGDKVYTVTEATTLTITDCPCTITRPVITTSAVVCHNKENCGGNYNSSAPGPYNTPVVPTATVVAPGSNPGYSNPGYPAVKPAGSVPAAPAAPAGTGAPPAGSQPGSPSTVPTAGAGKVTILSGAALAAVVGAAAFLL
ncbi:hypothetical protein OCS_04770 [Ophiocordyceps sinensis CO18]|uniref:Mmc protein n=1 Tax=Ophiocordyceps sinensis (strain Co18 / CGMCC 3.14243) TaxID=911162 RepID=T5A269_OPHSC|nr:hypothetical protein OCS_04770 [Ophiocordyceps sinensis CO18]